MALVAYWDPKRCKSSIQASGFEDGRMAEFRSIQRALSNSSIQYHHRMKGKTTEKNPGIGACDPPSSP